MKKKIVVRTFTLIFVTILSLFFYSNFIKQKTETPSSNKIIEENDTYSSNIMKNVSYSSEDLKGNKYTINAKEGEIDLSNSEVIFLKNVTAIINLVDSDIIEITSDNGKYNINNNDTIFTKNVIIDYLVNKVTGNYLDFSFERNSMIVTKNVIYTNENNILKADVIEIDVETKDTKIYMHEGGKQVNITNKWYYGNY